MNKLAKPISSADPIRQRFADNSGAGERRLLYAVSAIVFRIFVFTMVVVTAAPGCRRESASSTRPSPRSSEFEAKDDAAPDSPAAERELAPSIARDSQAAAEQPFADQVAQVRAGELDAVIVRREPIRDQEFAMLSGLGHLRELLLDEGQPSNNGIQSLAELTGLSHLRLRHTKINDEAAVLIASLPSLRILNLPQSRISDRGLASLAELTNLELLRVDGTQLTADGLASLSNHPSLRFVHLINAPVGDEGLASLAKIRHLESLYLDGATISDAAWEAFFAERPDVHVHLDQFHHDLDPGRHEHRDQQTTPSRER